MWFLKIAGASGTKDVASPSASQSRLRGASCSQSTLMVVVWMCRWFIGMQTRRTRRLAWRTRHHPQKLLFPAAGADTVQRRNHKGRHRLVLYKVHIEAEQVKPSSDVWHKGKFSCTKGHVFQMCWLFLRVSARGWLPGVHYPTDIFNKINALHLSLQGEGDVWSRREKVTAFGREPR